MDDPFIGYYLTIKQVKKKKLSLAFKDDPFVRRYSQTDFIILVEKAIIPITTRH